MTSRILVVACLLVLARGVFAQDQKLPGLPIEPASGEWTSLQNATDAALQNRLVARLNRNSRWRDLIRRKRMAVALVDLSDPEHPRMASVNGDEEMYAASLPKIAILLAAEQSIEDGQFELTEEVDRDMHAMIRRSSNAAATAMIDRVGMDRIAEVLTDPRYRLYDPDHGGGLWVGKRYARTGERHGDPLRNISHAATANQVSRFYYLAVMGRLVSPSRSRHMLQVLSNPGINHKFVHALSGKVPGSRIFRKSGSWRDWHADSILVWGSGWRRYILVALVKDAGGERIMRDLVGEAESVLRPGSGSVRGSTSPR